MEYVGAEQQTNKQTGGDDQDLYTHTHTRKSRKCIHQDIVVKNREKWEEEEQEEEQDSPTLNDDVIWFFQ